MNKNVIIRQIQVKDVMTKSNTPIGGYCVNPYVGCTHGCKYCYASFMKRFTGHTEEWGTFLDVKNWQPIKNLDKFKGEAYHYWDCNRWLSARRSQIQKH